jgi:hypothetical protein
MANYISDTVFDTGLAVLTTNADQLDICSAEPANWAGLAAVTLGNDAVTTGAAEDGDTDGRKVVVPAITAGSVTADGTAAFWALTDGTATLYASGPLSATQGVTNGNTFTLDAIDITIRDATAV